MSKKLIGRGVEFSDRHEVLFRESFGDELIRRWEGEEPAEHVEEVCWPVIAPSSCRTKCFGTGKKIETGDECVVVFGRTNEGRSIRLAVFRDVEALVEMMEYGRVDLPPTPPQSAKPQPVLPHMNVCYCIQCGARVLRPEEMSVRMFAALRRCAACAATNKPMPLGVERFCRTCGVPFLPKGKSGHSEATCPRHGRHSS